MITGRRCVLALALARPTASFGIRAATLRRASALTMQEGAAITVHCKSGPDGVSFGDCPFAHAVLLCLEAKSLSYSVEPHGPNNKPEWLKAEYEGKMPALEITGADGTRQQVVTESRTIGEAIDAICEPSLSPAGLEAADAAAAGFFPAMAGYVKNVEPEKDDELKKALLLALCKLDAHLAQSGTYLAGEKLSLADCFLAPKLYHMAIVAQYYKGFSVPPQFEALSAYMARTLQSEALVKTSPVPPMVRWGWANARKDFAEVQKAAEEALAEVASVA